MEKDVQSIFLKECIQQAFIALLKEKDINHITVTEIARKAGVSRMTYYRNFNSKEDIIRDHMEHLVESYRREAARHRTPGGHISYQNVLHCFQYFYDYREYIRQYISSGFGAIVEEAITGYVLDLFDTSGDPDRKYILHAYAGSIYHVYKTWLTDTDSFPPERLAAVIYRIFCSQI